LEGAIEQKRHLSQSSFSKGQPTGDRNAHDFRDAKILALTAETVSRLSVWRSRQLGPLPERAGQWKIFATRKYSRYWQSSSCLLSLILLPSVPVHAPCRSTGQLRQDQATATLIFSRRENHGVDSRNRKPLICLAQPSTWAIAEKGRAEEDFRDAKI
jgi:hypothetical protein